MTTLSNYPSDIPSDLAIRAYSGISHTPDERGAHEINDYCQHMTETYAHYRARAEQYGTVAALDEIWERYRQGYRRRKIASLEASSRLLSPMITGPANFPAARNDKAHASLQRRLSELESYDRRMLNAIEREINPDKRPIKTGDADAADRLADKIAKLEARQDAMRRSNAIIRANKGATAESLASLLIDAGLSESEANKVARPNCYGAIGYMSFELRNNLAEIKRLRGRLTKIERLQSLSPESQEADGLRVVYNPQINRVQLFFAAKPTYDERAALKRNGYRWSPRIGAWQAYYNRQSREYAQGLISSITQSA